jgi:hypothetical protein
MPTDDSDQNIGVAQCIIDHFSKIDSEGNAIDIPEYRILSVALHKPVENAAGHIGVGASV